MVYIYSSKLSCSPIIIIIIIIIIFKLRTQSSRERESICVLLVFVCGLTCTVYIQCLGLYVINNVL